jgi:hypothetical protein
VRCVLVESSLLLLLVKYNNPFVMHLRHHHTQALEESDSKWSQHRKIIPTKDRGIENSVPKGFAYVLRACV